MSKITIIFGVLLTGLAIYGYAGADPDHRSPTALIPAVVGLPLLICGVLALQERFRKHAMHVAAMFGLLGTLAAGGGGLPKIGLLFAENPEGNTRAVGMTLIMFALCAVFVGLCVKSFVDAGRRRRAMQASASA